MDLLDFEQTELYFDEPMTCDVARLIEAAADKYGSEDAETLLMHARRMAPQHLTVLVAMYRFYFYQHRFEDALMIGGSALTVAGRRLNFPDGWINLNETNLGEEVLRSMGLVRFYLMVLKAIGYLNLRLGHLDIGQAMLKKVVELDSHDRLGGAALLDVLHQSMLNEGNVEGSAMWTN